MKEIHIDNAKVLLLYNTPNTLKILLKKQDVTPALYYLSLPSIPYPVNPIPNGSNPYLISFILKLFLSPKDILTPLSS